MLRVFFLNKFSISNEENLTNITFAKYIAKKGNSQEQQKPQKSGK
jgi:hypothetical protein